MNYQKSEKRNETKPHNLKETQEALHASEIRYRRLFEAAKDGILILDADTGQIVDVNPFLINLLGYSYENLVNKAVWDIGFFKDILSSRENFLELKEKKYIRYEDLPLETASGRKIDVEFVSNVYLENNHNVIQCNIRDITERKHAADAILAEHEQLAVTLRSIGDGVISTDAGGNIVIMNTIAEELCGYTLNEARGRPLASVFNIINGDTREPHANPVDRVLETKQIIELENNTIIISKNGAERIIADSAAPIINKNKTIIGVVLVFRDITEKTKLLENLQRGQKLESLGLIAGGIAHDFNNLMGGVFGYVDLAMAASGEENVINFLSSAMSTIDRARGLTRQLLTFSKGGAPVPKVTVLVPFIEDTVKFALSGSTVGYRINMAKDLWPCIIDKTQICQVIDNLVINAQQAMPRGGIVEITAENISVAEGEHPVLKKGGYVKISIKDSGIGISRKIISSIFDPFFTTKPKGHGLGLSISYSIINRHGGEIDVESVLDEGSRFHVYLPASREHIVPDLEKNIEHTSSGTILVMDDEEVMRETISGMLETFGYSAICKNNGKDTLDFYNKESQEKAAICGLILDLTIPGGMGGIDVIRSIRTFNTEIPVFVASGYSDDPVMKNPAAYGFTASISKPFTINELADMLDIHMNKTMISCKSEPLPIQRIHS